MFCVCLYLSMYLHVLVCSSMQAHVDAKHQCHNVFFTSFSTLFLETRSLIEPRSIPSSYVGWLVSPRDRFFPFLCAGVINYVWHLFGYWAANIKSSCFYSKDLVHWTPYPNFLNYHVRKHFLPSMCCQGIPCYPK